MNLVADVDYLVLPDAHSRRKQKPEAAYRRMTIDEAKKLKIGDEVEIIDASGGARRVKVVLQPRTFVLQKNRVEITVQLGSRNPETTRVREDDEREGKVQGLVVRRESH